MLSADDELQMGMQQARDAGAIGCSVRGNLCGYRDPQVMSMPINEVFDSRLSAEARAESRYRLAA